ncbi:MAG: hypothetical protein ABSE20_16995 [Acetobacteraceae bacterium]|jgi:hypothetical protein
MLEAILNLAGLLLMIIVACHTIVLHRRLTRLRGALAEAGTVLPSLDASVGRMSEVVNGFAQRLQTDLGAVEARLAAARRVAAELASVNRSAEEASVNLDRLLRQHRRMEDVRPVPIPREFVEPKGFAERAGLPKITPPDPAELAASPDSGRSNDLRAEPRRRLVSELVS